jgi:hypothetical protein
VACQRESGCSQPSVVASDVRRDVRTSSPEGLTEATMFAPPQVSATVRPSVPSVPPSSRAPTTALPTRRPA